MIRLAYLILWGVAMGTVAFLLGAPAWGVMLAALLALHGYCNQLQTTMARTEARRR